MEDKNKIDEFFRKGMAGYSPTPPPALWENIAAGVQPGGGKKKFIWFWPLLALVFISCAGIYIYTSFDQRIATIEAQQKNETLLSQSSDNQKTNKTQQDKNRYETQAEGQSNNADAQSQEQSTFTDQSGVPHNESNQGKGVLTNTFLENTPSNKNLRTATNAQKNSQGENSAQQTIKNSTNSEQTSLLNNQQNEKRQPKGLATENINTISNAQSRKNSALSTTAKTEQTGMAQAPNSNIIKSKNSTSIVSETVRTSEHNAINPKGTGIENQTSEFGYLENSNSQAPRNGTFQMSFMPLLTSTLAINPAHKTGLKSIELYTHTPRKSQWQIGLHAYGSIDYRKLDVASGTAQLQSSNGESELDQNENRSFGQGAELTIGYSPNRNIYFDIGIGFNKWCMGGLYPITLVPDIPDTAIDPETTDYTGQVSTSYSIVSAETTLTNDIDLFEALNEPFNAKLKADLCTNSLVIPMYVRYYFGQKRLKPMVRTGASYHMLLSKKLNYTVVGNENDLKIDVTEPNFMSFLNFQYEMGLSWQRPRQTLELAGGFRTALTPLSQNDALSTLPYSFYARLGMYFSTRDRLKKK